VFELTLHMLATPFYLSKYMKVRLELVLANH